MNGPETLLTWFLTFGLFHHAKSIWTDIFMTSRQTDLIVFPAGFWLPFHHTTTLKLTPMMHLICIQHSNVLSDTPIDASEAAQDSAYEYKEPDWSQREAVKSAHCGYKTFSVSVAKQWEESSSTDVLLFHKEVIKWVRVVQIVQKSLQCLAVLPVWLQLQSQLSSSVPSPCFWCCRHIERDIYHHRLSVFSIFCYLSNCSSPFCKVFRGQSN